MSRFARTARVEVTTSGNQLVTIRNLRISFTAEKTEGKDPNTLTLEIYNLSENTRNLITNPDEKQSVALFAGYVNENGEELVFTGDITHITHEIIKPDVITSIKARDGKEPVNKAKVSFSLGEKASAKAVLERVLGAFDIGSNINQVNIPSKIYENGYAFAGLAKKALNEVTEFLGLTWSVQNNIIVITLFDGDDNTGAVVLSPTTGMIGSPRRITGEARKAKNASRDDSPGWRVNSLLLPSINPLGKIFVQSREIEQQTPFTAYTVTHTGDTFGRDWNTAIEVKE